MMPSADDQTRVSDLQPHDARALAEDRSALAPVIDVVGVVAFLALDGWLFWRLTGGLGEASPLAIAGTVIGAYVFADFMSGLFHWIGDTWGTPSTPLIGRTIVRPFREHHVDQLEITRLGFFHITGPNCVISLPPLIGTHLVALEGAGSGVTLLALFVGTLLFWMFATNQHHKWAHQTTRPGWVTSLQRWNLVLPFDHHQVHHEAPHMKYYCITNGWMNAPLHRLRFLRGLEHAITAATGLIPREHDTASRTPVESSSYGSSAQVAEPGRRPVGGRVGAESSETTGCGGCGAV